mgnify:CR=1 FL=1
MRNLTNRIIINLKPSDRKAVQAAADKAGLPLATYIRQAAIVASESRR